MAFQVDGVDWDSGNRAKCRNHGVSLAEIEALFGNEPAVQPDLAHSLTETRYKAIGRVKGRYIFAVFTLRRKAGGVYIRPISARYMHEKEVKRYEQRG